MKNKLLICSLLGLLAFAACDDGVTDYSKLQVSKGLCMFTWRGTGVNPVMKIDDGPTLNVLSKGNYAAVLKPDTAYRMAASYILLADKPDCCKLQGLAFVPVLADSTGIPAAECDTLCGISSVWMGGGFVNVTVEHKYDGQRLPQTFGYRLDSKETLDNGATRWHLSLFFRQDKGDDLKLSNSCTLSIAPERVGMKPGDELVLHTVWKDVDIKGNIDRGKKDFSFKI